MCTYGKVCTGLGLACPQALYLRISSITTTEINIRYFITSPFPEIQLIRQSVKFFTEVVYVSICICTYLTIALFTGLIPV